MLPTSRPDTTTKATEAQVLQALASLAGLPSRQADEDGIDRNMYFVALAGVSRYALSEAVKAIVRGALGHTFYPSPIEFRQQCDRAMGPHLRQAERVRIREHQRQLRADSEKCDAQRTPEAIARQQAAYKRFCDGIAKDKTADDEAERAEIRARYGMSPEVLATIGNQSDPSPGFRKPTAGKAPRMS